MVDAKLDEKLLEYHEEQDLVELVDLLEVFYATISTRGYFVEKLETYRLKNRRRVTDYKEKISERSEGMKNPIDNVNCIVYRIVNNAIKIVT